MSGQAAFHTQSTAKPTITPVVSGILQRQCACGNRTTAGGECESCRKKREGRLQHAAVNSAGVGEVPPIVHDVLRSPGQPLDAGTRAFMEPRFGHDFSQTRTYTRAAGTIQTKLAINKPGDEYEQEADRIADQVLAAPVHPDVSGAPPRIQRFTGQPSAPMGTAPASVDRALAGSGRPLDAALRQDMEQRFGHDFSRVRVHTDAAAEQSAWDVNAHAYTVGHNIVFGAGRLAPETHAGRRLIAHELTHVVQQRGWSRGLIQRQPIPADEFAPKGPQEQAREEVANALLTASRKLDQAIQNRNNDVPLPMDVFDAYERFFSGSGLDKLDLLKTRIDEAMRWIQTIPFDPIPNPVPLGYRDEAVHRRGIAKPDLHAAAIQPPLSADFYIALYPPWYANAATRTAVIVHELFHFFLDVSHNLPPAPTEPPWENARAYQGFVGTLAGLPEPAGITAMFPP